MFFVGVDVLVLMGCECSEVCVFWCEFFVVCVVLVCLLVLVVVVIIGYSLVGGVVLLLFCDYCVMVEGLFKIGFNEVQVGLSVFDCIQFVLCCVVGIYCVEWLFVVGVMIEFLQVLVCGMVDEFIGVEQVFI